MKESVKVKILVIDWALRISNIYQTLGVLIAHLEI